MTTEHTYLSVLTDLPRNSEMGSRLRAAWIATGQDPLLHELRQARRRITQARQDMRTLIALAREFTRPRPYTLTDLADAAGMSPSGIRTAYGPAEVTQLIAIFEQATPPDFLSAPIAALTQQRPEPPERHT